MKIIALFTFCLLLTSCGLSFVNRSVVIYQCQEQNENAFSEFREKNKSLPNIGNIGMEGGAKQTELTSAASQGAATVNQDRDNKLAQKAKETAVSTAVKRDSEVVPENVPVSTDSVTK